MKGILPILIALLIGVTPPKVIDVHVPTAEEEAVYLWRTLQDLPMLEQFQYQVVFPSGELIKQLKQKARNNELEERDYQDLLGFMQSEVYSSLDYESGREKILSQASLLYGMIGQLRKSRHNWNFKMFESYKVALTLYGPGGSYDVENGSILLYTTSEGQFKQYDNPACTIIHEIVHMGIEESLIQPYNVPHPMKERIVDRIVHLNFKEQLPEYRIQDMGDDRIDPYLLNPVQLKDLDQYIDEVLTTMKPE